MITQTARKLIIRFSLSTFLLPGASSAMADIKEDSNTVLGCALAIFNNESMTVALNKLGTSGEPLRTRYEASLWELYKAYKGVDIVGNEVRPGRSGKNRRQSLRNAALSLKDLTWVQFKNERVAHDLLEAKFESVLNATLQQDTILNGRATLSLAGSYNPIYSFLPARVPGQVSPDIANPTPTQIEDAAAETITIEKRAKALRTVLVKIPVEHRRLVYPIFLLKAKPNGDGSGGFWPISETNLFLNKEATTGVKYSELQALLMTDANGAISEGLIGVPKGRIAVAGDTLGSQVWGFTVTHEIGHNIDHALRLGLISGPIAVGTASPLPGQKYKREPHPAAGERVAEAYSRYFMSRAKLCRSHEQAPRLPETQSQTECNTEVIRYFNGTKAQKLRKIIDANGSAVFDENGEPLEAIFR